MEKFTVKKGKLIALLRGNVDTDQIISKEFLKSIRRTGYGEHLFADWRYNDKGQPNPTFELNAPEAQGATVLLTGNNFGCGSSREHAVWAITQYGFHTVIAPRKVSESGLIPGFADIFRNNSTKNGLLLIELEEAEVQKIAEWIRQEPNLQVTVDLPSQSLSFHLKSSEEKINFTIESAVKDKLIQGLDEIGLTELHLKSIDSFEKTHSSQMYV